MHRRGTHRVDLVERGAPGFRVGRLAGDAHRVNRRITLVSDGGVSGVADHQFVTTGAADDDALVTERVTWRRHHPDAFGYLGVTVDKLEAGARKVEPLPRHTLLAPRPFQLRSLDIEGRVLEN